MRIKIRATAEIASNDLVEVITEMEPYEISDFILMLTEGFTSTSIGLITDRLVAQATRKANSR